jgi:ABC-type multidrug transport system permease subunit
MRWIAAKDLRILRRSPLLVGLLVVYPAIVALLIGFALSRGPEKPTVAIVNEVPESGQVISLGGEEIDVARYAQRLFEAIDAVEVDSREEALEKVRAGDVLAALIVPADVTARLQAGLEPAEIEVVYNAEDPVKREYVENTIKAQVQDANAALTREFTKVAVEYLDLLASGGEFTLLGREIDVLGLARAEAVLRDAQSRLPAGSAQRTQLESVIRFARLARQNLDLADEVLSSVGTPIRVRQRVLEGGSTPLSSFASSITATISLMFVAILLAAGLLAIEREEHAFSRLVRGLVSPAGLLVAKALVAAAVAAPVALATLLGLSLFVDLDVGRLPLWAAAVALGALAFSALGLAIGALAREVRAASLLAFALALPIAFVSLVPSGSVSGALYDVIRAIAALFPFKPALDATNAALHDAGGLAAPLAHLAALALAFGALARLALRRFA